MDTELLYIYALKRKGDKSVPYRISCRLWHRFTSNESASRLRAFVGSFRRS